ncbi:MAG: DUF1217 domain-containing protein [Alphaproteobacteria bacterium]|nr:DUF1217 domain-containing protein [Alphaproteobacteria bacterium]
MLPTIVQVNIAAQRVADATTRGAPDLSSYQKEIDYFRRNIGRIQSDIELVNDKRIFDFAMAAFDLPNDSNARGYVRNLLLQNPDDPAAPINQLENKRYGEFARLFRFPGSGQDAVRTPSVVEAIIQRFRDMKTAEARLETVVDPTSSRNVSTAQRLREIQYFVENIGKVKSADDLVSDYRLYQFLVTAFDLQGQENAQGLIKKLISQDFNDEASLYNRLRNAQFREFANFFQFPGAGERNVQDKRQVMAVVDRYVEVATEIQEGEANPGVRLALYFDRNAGDVQSYFGLLSDRPLREFIFTTFSLPSELNGLPVNRLAARIEQLVDLNDLYSQEGRQKLIRRYAAVYDAQNASAGVGGASIVSLFRPIGLAGASASSLFAAAVSR